MSLLAHWVIEVLEQVVGVHKGARWLRDLEARRDFQRGQAQRFYSKFEIFQSRLDV